ncbi:hypothetical protein B0H16DRAFT_756770 [Mycena metata]|uniref:Uncharacterized protein n=1 Tax=Mycena metata TaxID=1033252 RepID=A0AAD7J1T7_9AGAR|nr:hypothetical protein B0H16DRAFT_756770 [Mycena metata]
MGKKNKSKNTQAPQADSHSRTEPDVSIQKLLVLAHLSYGEKSLVEDVSRLLRIPDYNTARGLKQCYQDFGTISSNLEQVFTQSRENGGSCSADKLAAAVISIYRHMSRDQLLRIRIIAETDFVNKAISLLNTNAGAAIAMSALSDMTHIESVDAGIRQSIVPLTSAILDTAEKCLHILPYVEDTVCVLTHSITAVLVDNVDPKLAQLVPFPRVLHFLLRVVRLPNSTARIFDHIIAFCARAAGYYPTVFSSIPDIVDFLVACTRAEDLVTRNDALRALTRLFRQKPRQQPPVPRSMRVHQALTRYGIAKIRQTKEMEAVQKLFHLTDSFADNPHPLYLAAFGHELVDLILIDETKVRFYFLRPGEDGLDVGDIGIKSMRRIPTDILRLSADAVRSKSGAQAQIKGDILELEFLLASQKSKEAFTFARSCIDRHPSVPFFYYAVAVCLSTSTVTSVRSAEKGLQCPDLTDFLREELSSITSCLPRNCLLPIC